MQYTAHKIDSRTPLNFILNTPPLTGPPPPPQPGLLLQLFAQPPSRQHLVQPATLPSQKQKWFIKSAKFLAILRLPPSWAHTHTAAPAMPMATQAGNARSVLYMCRGFSLQPNLLTFALPFLSYTTHPATAPPLEHFQVQPYCPDSRRPPPHDPAFLRVSRHLPIHLCCRCFSKRTLPCRQGRQHRLPTPLLHSSLILSPQHQH